MIGVNKYRLAFNLYMASICPKAPQSTAKTLQVCKVGSYAFSAAPLVGKSNSLRRSPPCSLAE